MPQPTSLIAFKTPYVKGDKVALPILSGAGEWGELATTRGTLEALSTSLTNFLGRSHGRPPSHANPSVRQPILKPKGGIA